MWYTITQMVTEYILNPAPIDNAITVLAWTAGAILLGVIAIPIP